MKTRQEQLILIFEQNGSARSKIQGIRQYGQGTLMTEVVSIEGCLPPVLDDTAPFLPAHLDADLVLDFLKHPDLSHDLAIMCAKARIPVIASGKKLRVEGVLTPPT
jgi:thymidylate synthase